MPKRLLLVLTPLFVLALVGVGLIVFAGPATLVTPPVLVQLRAGGIPTMSRDARVSPANDSLLKTNSSVIRVIDGDTFVAKLDAEEGEWTIRMLGIDTPETVDPRKPVQCFGKEASKKLSELLDGKRVRLAADPQADERDKYQRWLRNVYLEDETDVNALMVREGYAHAYLSFPLKALRKKELRLAEEEAKREKRGFWADGICDN